MHTPSLESPYCNTKPDRSPFKFEIVLEYQDLDNPLKFFSTLFRIGFFSYCLQCLAKMAHALNERFHLSFIFEVALRKELLIHEQKRHRLS